jgi:rod shape-determining protein MreD
VPLPGFARAWDTSARDGAVPATGRREGPGSRDPLSAEEIRDLMGLLLAAIGAAVTALVEATLGPFLSVGDAAPHPVLVGGVIWTIAAGIDRGIAWAFVGGLVLDSLLGRPLGTTVVALLLAIGGAALIAQPFPRLRLAAPILAVPILSLVYSMLIIGIESAVEPGVTVPDAGRLFLPGVAYDAIIGMFLGPLAVTLHDRRITPDRVDW